MLMRFPPLDFVAGLMQLAVMAPASGTVNSSLTLRPQGPWLGKA